MNDNNLGLPPRSEGPAPALPSSGRAGFIFADRESYRTAWDASETLDPEVPLCVDLELASLCGLRCPTCFWGDSGFQKEMGGASPVMSKQLMPTELAIRLVLEAAKIGVPSLKFHGRGDGIHHRDYVEILRFAADMRESVAARGGFLELLINTHGNSAYSKMDGLVLADKVMLSIDSVVPATYTKMRVGGRLGDVIWTAEELLKRGHKNVWVRRVITDDNRHENFVDDCKAIFGPKVHVSEHFAFNHRNSQKVSVHHEDESSWGRRFCQYPSVRLMCLANGDVVPCCVDWRAEMVVGNVNSQSLAEIWTGQPIRKLRAELRAGVLTSSVCKSCTSFQSYSRPERKFVSDHEGKAVI